MSPRRPIGQAEVPFDALERQQLCDLLVELGPDAPTLLEPWTTHDLAAHLVLREHDYLAAPGLVLPGRWQQFAARRTAKLAERDFASLIDQVRSGPPPGFFRIGWVRRVANLNEFFVHHEDVRRANGRGPRSNGGDFDAALWRNVTRTPWFLARRLRRVGLELEWAGTNERVRARRGEPTARLVGSPSELLLYLPAKRATCAMACFSSSDKRENRLASVSDISIPPPAPATCLRFHSSNSLVGYSDS